MTLYKGTQKVCPIVTIEPTLTTKNITQNGTYNASSDNADGYSSVTVNVPTVTPTGTISINSNGTYDVTNYASADVSVGGGIPTTLYCFRSKTLTPRAMWFMSIEGWVVQKALYPLSSSRLGATTDEFFYDSDNQILLKWDGAYGEVTDYTRYARYDVSL